MVLMLTNAPTVEQSNSRSAWESSATGEVQARKANHPATSVQKAIMPKSDGAFPRLHKAGNEAQTERESASIAGPQDHERVWGPIVTARTIESNRKMEVGTGMVVENQKSGCAFTRLAE